MHFGFQELNQPKTVILGMRRKLFYALLLIFILADACVERISLSSAEADTQLVEDGSITDEPGPYTVKQTQTQKLFDAPKIKTISDKSLSVIDNISIINYPFPYWLTTSINKKPLLWL